MDLPTRIAAYIRVSTEEQAEHGFSIDAQREMIIAHAKLHNQIIVDEYVDMGISGKSIKGRPELQRLLSDVKEGKFDEVLVWKTSRLARKSLDLFTIVEFLNNNGISVRSLTEQFETATPSGKLSFQMLGVIAEFERNTIVENVKMGMKQRARTGKWNGGVVLGYETMTLKQSSNRRERETKLVIVPEEAALVRRIFELYASGKGLKAITNQLNHEGHRTKKGNPFAVYGISDILRNPLYVGNIRYNVHENWSDKRRKGTNKNPIIVKGIHEPIISQELWDRVQTLYSKKGGKSPRVFQGSFPLTSLLRCPQCRSGMVAHHVKDKLKDGTVVVRRYYICGAFLHKGSAVCSYNGVKADLAERAVFDRLRNVVSSPEVLQDVVDSINRRRGSTDKPVESELASVEKALSTVKAKKDKWYKLYEEDGIDHNVLFDRLNQLKDESERLESRRLDLQRAMSRANTKPVPFAVVKTVLTKFQRLMDASPPEQQKALLHLLVKRIEIKDRKVGLLEICLDEKLQSSFFEEGPSGSPEGPFNFKGVFPLSITL